MRWTLGFLLLVSLGCARTRYVPDARTDYAFLLFDGGVYFHVNRPQVRALSMTTPFECNERTVALATGATGAPAPEATIERFGSMQDPYSAQVYRLLTVSGPDHTPGPPVIIISGERTLDAAVSALNVVHRYNDVAECVRRFTNRTRA